MSDNRCINSAVQFALAKANELEAEARRVGIMRSVDATKASTILLDLATHLRDLVGIHSYRAKLAKVREPKDGVD